MNVSFFSDLLSTISERGRGLIGLSRGDEHARASVADIVKLSGELISRRGEASGVALARIILDRYASLPQKDRFAFLIHVAGDFGSDEAAIEHAIDSYRKTPSRAAAHALHEAAEPRSQELIRRLNLANGGTLSLVRMREDLIDLFQTLRTERSDAAVAVESLDQDFVHLFSSWFNRGFLVLRRIDWTTPAHILEKIIRYEAVHEISDWDDLRRRIAPADRRCFAFFHPALVDEPLIFVEVALTTEIPAPSARSSQKERDPIPLKAGDDGGVLFDLELPGGLAGVSFGNFLIKQVVEDLKPRDPEPRRPSSRSRRRRALPRWLAREIKGRRADRHPGRGPRALCGSPTSPNGSRSRPPPRRCESRCFRPRPIYFLRAKTATGRPVDPVARFHLGNGARLERLNFLGDMSPKGLQQSAWADGELPLRPRRDREEPRSLRQSRRGDRLERGHASAAARRPDPRRPAARGGGESRDGNHLYDLLRSRAKDPKRPSPSSPTGAGTATSDVDDVSARFANALVDLGVEPGDRVAVQVEKSIEAIMLYLGTIRAGAVFLPLNTAYTPAEIEYFVGDAEPRVFVCDPVESRGAEADRGEGRRAARDARRLIGRRMSRPARSSDRTLAAPTRFDDVARGPDDLARDPLHLGHDRALEGRHADARQPRLERRDARSDSGASRPTTCSSTRCRSSTPTGCSSRRTRCSSPAPSMIFLAEFDPDEVFEVMPRATAMMGVPTFYTRLLQDPRLTAEATAAHAPVHLGLGAASRRDASRMAGADRPRHPRALRHDRDRHEHLEPLRGRAHRRHRRASRCRASRSASPTRRPARRSAPTRSA